MKQLSEESMAVADVYAQALLEAVADSERQQEIADQLADLASLVGRDPGLEMFLVAETIEPKLRRESLERLFRGRMNDLLLNLLQVLNRRRRLALLRSVQRCVELRLEDQRQQQEVTVRTAVPLWHELRTAIQRVIGLWSGKSVILVEEVDPGIIGGLVLRVGDTLIDGSLRSRLNELRSNLYRRTEREMHKTTRYATGS
ncbi:MAG TPA: ATP synthase F1 subunit delta [Phycisphaerae bacterium]|nr:ATP synthase F1 subunit delta [Phycisphaerae bacterium]